MTATKPLEADHPSTADRLSSTELYAFRDRPSGMWLRFYTPERRYDLWEEYVAGARRTYRKFQVERALALPTITPESAGPVFAVATDDDGVIRAGWYVNGPLQSVSDGYAPRELATEPVSASLATAWISEALPAGVIEVKAVWVDPAAEAKAALADLMSRAFIHAMRFLDVRYAYCSAAEHAAPRWCNSGARELPGIIPARYPDDRYRTTFLSWDAETALELSTPAQRRLFLDEHHQAVNTYSVRSAHPYAGW